MNEAFTPQGDTLITNTIKNNMLDQKRVELLCFTSLMNMGQLRAWEPTISSLISNYSPCAADMNLELSRLFKDINYSTHCLLDIINYALPMAPSPPNVNAS